MAEQCYVGVDLGAESGRVIVGRFDGRTIELDPLHRFANGPVQVADTLRWNVLGLWSEIQNGLAKSATQYGGKIASVGVDTWGVDYALFDKAGEMLGQAWHYRDPRTRGMMESAFATVSRPEIFSQTGLQFLEFNTLFQLIAMRRSDPALLKSADRLLMMPDLFHWMLSGARVVEFTNATTTQCFHAVRGEWAFDMLNQFDLPTAMFPEVVPPGTNLGPLRENIAARTGLKRIDVIAPATHDTGAAVAAVPTDRTGSPTWSYISSGTWSLMGVEVQDAILTGRALELNVTNEGGIDGTYRLLKNIAGMWLVQESRRSFERSGRSFDYAQLAKMAADSTPYRSLINPDDRRFLTPDDMPTAIRERCRELGEPVPENEGQLVRCALDSLAMRYRMVLGWLEELTGVKVEVIHVVGGGSQNELLNQLTANVCGRPVIAGPVEATALGNVLVQARSRGELSTLADIRAVVRASSDLKQYEPRDRDLAEQAYSRFTRVVANG
ncbi:MAG: rhamnulokinase family protein [Planctomycetaceae bacterium]